MQSPEMQRSMQQAMMGMGLRIGPMVNRFLAKHGLKEVH
jgi:hypothetical protein